jgi:hypothetical protein
MFKGGIWRSSGEDKDVSHNWFSLSLEKEVIGVIW